MLLVVKVKMAVGMEMPKVGTRDKAQPEERRALSLVWGEQWGGASGVTRRGTIEGKEEWRRRTMEGGKKQRMSERFELRRWRRPERL